MALETDTSLSVSGKAADAKVTGDEITDLKSAIKLETEYAPHDDVSVSAWTQGGINANNGKTIDSQTRIRSSGYENYDNYDYIVVDCPQSFVFGLREYSDNSGSYTGFVISPTGTGWKSGRYYFEPVKGRYYRWVLAQVDTTSAITPSTTGIDEFNIYGIKDITDAIYITEEHIPSLWMQGGINYTNGAPTTENYDIRIRSKGYVGYEGAERVNVSCGSSYKFKIFEYSNHYGQADTIFVQDVIGEFANEYTLYPVDGHYYRYMIGCADDGEISPSDINSVNLNISVIKSVAKKISSFETELDNACNQMFNSDVGNCGILCAKEHHFVDGTPPEIEWYLLGDPTTNNVYYSKDLTDKTYLFTFPERVGYWSFGIDKNNNIICCKQAEYLADTEAHDDSLRVNPIVYSYADQYQVPHEVIVGEDVNPCGWLSSFGFICLANGDILISEYTRPVVETSNVWKISGDPNDGSNWIITKTYSLSGSDTGFKHVHCVLQDFYTGVCYHSTGDDDTSSHCYYSTDNGSTWILGKENSEKYCRFLNLIFTEDYIYWATDTNKANMHFVFRAARNANGILDFNNIVDRIEIPLVSGLATYGCIFFKGYNALLLLERCDNAQYAEMPVRLYDISNNTLHTVYTLKAVNGTGHLGFRTRFADFYPRNNIANLAWHLRGTSIGSRGYNENAILGNQVTTGNTSLTVNNAEITLFKDDGTYRMTIGTHYI